MRMINADDLEQALKDIGLAEVIDSNKYTSAWGVPIVDAEPIRHGKWIECESENGIHFHKCSECGMRDMYQGTFTDWNGRGFSFYYKRFYCPNCGSRNDGEGEES